MARIHTGGEACSAPGPGPPWANMRSAADLGHLRRAIELALEAERAGNMPIGAVLVLEDHIVAEGANASLVPEYHPGKHAEMVALAQVPAALWPRASEMSCYSTLEPCLMCMSSLLLHGVGRVVYGARDDEGGAEYLTRHLPEYYQDHPRGLEVVGPLLEAECRPMYERARDRFRALPCA